MALGRIDGSVVPTATKADAPSARTPGVEIVAPPTPKAADMTPVTTPRASVRTSRGRPACSWLADALDDHGHALTAADAHGFETHGLVERLQVVDQRRHDAGAGHAEGVPEGDGAAVGIELVVDADAELVAHGQHLGGERLVELDDVDIGDLHPGLGQDLAHGVDGTDAHDLGRTTGHRAGDDADLGLQAEGAGPLV